MKDFLMHSIFVLVVIAIFIGVFAVDKWFGSFWGFLLGFVLFVSFIIGTIFVVRNAMGEVSKYRAEVEMEEEKEIADSFNKCNKGNKIIESK
jgi:uncharacterized membrane protein (DUF485 family)